MSGLSVGGSRAVARGLGRPGGGAISTGPFAFNQEKELLNVVERDQIIQAMVGGGPFGKAVLLDRLG
jgi:hypothetical protein